MGKLINDIQYMGDLSSPGLLEGTARIVPLAIYQPKIHHDNRLQRLDMAPCPKVVATQEGRLSSWKTSCVHIIHD
jgi:hypothetical protein